MISKVSIGMKAIMGQLSVYRLINVTWRVTLQLITCKRQPPTKSHPQNQPTDTWSLVFLSSDCQSVDTLTFPRAGSQRY